jgi:hypothetical protein
VRRFFPLFRFTGWALCALSLFSLRAYGQDKNQIKGHPNGVVQDWSRRHLLYPRVGPLRSLISLQSDPRAVMAWQESARKDWGRWRTPRPVRTTQSGFHTDWSVSLGTGSIASAMYPAKYGFDATATVTTANCTSDYIAFPINVAGASPTTITANVTITSTNVPITSGTITTEDVGQPISGAGIPAGDTIAAIDTVPATIITLAVAATASGTGETLTITGQPNIVGFNNLYSGTAGSTGICNRSANPGVDDGVSATAAWSYFIDGDSQFADPFDPVNYAATSPILSLDGTKVAIALSDPRPEYAFFIVLAPRSGDGVTTNLQNVTSPAVINSFSSTAVTANSGTATYLLLDYDGPISSPFMNYLDDSAYIGDRNGNLYHILNVFCTTAACQTGGTPQPSLDLVWEGFNGVFTGCPGNLTSPVVDAFNHVFVGCSDGNLYGFDSSANALPGSPITVGNGGATGGIVDAPLVDMVNGYLYVAAGNSSGATSVVAQIQDTGTSMALIGTATLDPGGAFNLHLPGFNEDYFSSGTSSNWLLYEYSANNGGSSSSLWGIGFGANHVMNTGTPTNVLTGTSGAFERSPITTFFNGTTDFLFSSDLGASVGDSGVANYDITGSFPTTNLAFTAEGEGTSGIIVDNDSGAAQASSIYFGVLGTGSNANSAVKLTQSGLE